MDVFKKLLFELQPAINQAMPGKNFPKTFCVHPGHQALRK